MALIPEKLKNLTERSQSDRDTREELLEKVEKFFSQKEEYYNELEDAVSSFKKGINQLEVPFPWDDESSRRELQEHIKTLKASLKIVDDDLAFFKGEPVATLASYLSPELVVKLECIAEELDSIIENLELGLKFHKQFIKLEEGFKEYTKKAKKINLSKKVV